MQVLNNNSRRIYKEHEFSTVDSIGIISRILGFLVGTSLGIIANPFNFSIVYSLLPEGFHDETIFMCIGLIFCYFCEFLFYFQLRKYSFNFMNKMYGCLKAESKFFELLSSFAEFGQSQTIHLSNITMPLIYFSDKRGFSMMFPIMSVSFLIFVPTWIFSFIWQYQTLLKGQCDQVKSLRGGSILQTKQLMKNGLIYMLITSCVGFVIFFKYSFIIIHIQPYLRPLFQKMTEFIQFKNNGTNFTLESLNGFFKFPIVIILPELLFRLGLLVLLRATIPHHIKKLLKPRIVEEQDMSSTSPNSENEIVDEENVDE
eukprot:TRINITY_DN2576_c0_g1_i1.p1 TRINITY_DN2576_c0_g1~~TRINITY_DN2576_c0_g1_i1.p1  ORF type:complete len:322 (+),score=58.97 TRINITY_DN2576_c0_g1_i1:27-968(+)